MDALKLREEVSKPGLLQAVRAVFDPVVDPVAGRKFAIGACLMSGQWHSFSDHCHSFKEAPFTPVWNASPMLS